MKNHLPTIARVLRATRVLQIADNMLFMRNLAANRASNEQFLAGNPDFVPPPMHLAFDAYNTINWEDYCRSGAQHAALIKDIIKRHIKAREISVCEWGCGPARVIRNLTTFPEYDAVQLYGTDYNRETIQWCRQNIEGVSFLNNTLEPPLPFRSGSLDCIYALSVFTHLSATMHYAWIDELFRVLKPNGILIFTTHGNLCSNRLLADEQARYKAGRLVVRDKIQEGKKHFLAYHPPRFIEHDLLKVHQVVEHIDDARPYGYEQDVWVASGKMTG